MISDEEVSVGNVIYFFALPPYSQESKLRCSALVAGIVTGISKNKTIHLANWFFHNNTNNTYAEHKHVNVQSEPSRFIIPYNPMPNQGNTFTEKIVATPKSVLKYSSQERDVSLRLFDKAKIGLLGKSIEDVLAENFEKELHIGDLMLASRANMRTTDHYIGFISSMNLDNITLSNYHPRMRHPWIKRNNFNILSSELHNIATLRKYDDFTYMDD